MKPARFHPEAEVELAAEAKFYEEQWRGLGERFTEEVEAALKLASLFPEIGAPYKYGTRRVFPKKFPFSITGGKFPAACGDFSLKIGDERISSQESQRYSVDVPLGISGEVPTGCV